MKSATAWVVAAVAVVVALQYTGREASQPRLGSATGASRAEWSRAPPQQPIYQSAPAQAVYYKGYRCTVDCSGHEAGYRWAEEHDIDDPDDCGGNSESFIEGCRSYAEEQRAEADKDEDDEEDDDDDEE